MQMLCECCGKQGKVSYFRNVTYLSCKECSDNRMVPSYVVSATLFDHTEEEVKKEWFKLVGGKYKLLKEGKEISSADELHKEATWMMGFERQMIMSSM